ncbi:MAG: GNAT family N-acetyltransferase [Bdellovibrionales bacterium]|nr:GNAT family N-acetyltransferase [Bdellovibrionales bacterium]
MGHKQYGIDVPNMETSMHLIQPIFSITHDRLEAIVPGYSSSYVFQVSHKIAPRETTFSLTLKKLDVPFVKKHDYSNPETLVHYNDIARQGASYGAFVNNELVGFIVGEIQSWNSTLVIREFGVSPHLQRQGIGKALLEAALGKAKQEGLRGVLCETQSTNVPAVEFYQRFGFTIQGLDLSLYRNDDLDRGEVAVFLRKAIV